VVLVGAGKQLDAVDLQDVEDDQVCGGLDGGAVPAQRPSLKLPDVAAAPGGHHQLAVQDHVEPGARRRAVRERQRQVDPLPGLHQHPPGGRTAERGNRRSWPPSPGRRAAPRSAAAPGAPRRASAR